MERNEMESCTYVSPHEKQIYGGCRKLTVYYNPAGDPEDLDYVRLVVEPENDEEGGNDSIALILAAAKRLADTSPAIDEDSLGTELLSVAEDFVKMAVLEQLIGGDFFA